MNAQQESRQLSPKDLGWTPWVIRAIADGKMK